MARIVIVSINFWPELIGVGRYTGELAIYLARKDNDVTVISAIPHYPAWRPLPPYRNRYAVEYHEGVQVIRCPIWLPMKMKGVARLLAPLSFAITAIPVTCWVILRNIPHAVLCVEPTLFSSIVPLLIAKCVRARTALHVQDLEVDAAFATGHLRGGLARSIGLALDKRLMRAFDLIVTISNSMKRNISRKIGFDRNIRIVRNWVDVTKFRETGAAIDFRKKLGIPVSAYTVLYSGNIGVKQGLEVLLDAAGLLRNEDRILFVVCGNGPEKSRLQREYNDLNNVRFIPLQPEAVFPEFLKFVDAHVIPQREGVDELVLPSKLGGALASGRQVIVTANAGSELATFLSGVALIVPAGDSVRLAEAIGDVARRDQKSPDSALKLAESLSSERALAIFEDLLLGRPAAEERAGADLEQYAP